MEIDLVCLVADKNMEAAIQGLLERHTSLRIRKIQCKVLVHPRRDPGVFHEAAALLKSYRRQARHALVLLDYEWDGRPKVTAKEMEKTLRERLERDFGSEWAEVVVIEPELEVWVFSPSPHVEQVLGWAGHVPALREALEQHELWPQTDPKPSKPKKALEYALRTVKKPRSSSLYRELARRVSLDGCRDPSFVRLKKILKTWFSA